MFKIGHIKSISTHTDKSMWKMLNLTVMRVYTISELLTFATILNIFGLIAFMSGIIFFKYKVFNHVCM